MAVLLIRLAAPMQSWGTQSRFTHRDTGREPSKSGVIGLFCAALGRPRQEDVSDLARLKMDVRVDCEGSIKKDYHTAMYIIKACGSGTKECEPSDRYYLTDADFLVALSGDKNLLTQIDDALKKPKWQLFLGRKSFLPASPLCIPNGFMPEEKSGMKVLMNWQWPRGISEFWPWSDKPDERLLPRKYKQLLKDSDSTDCINLRFIAETEFGIGEQVVCDQPDTTFDDRSFMIRHVTNTFENVPVRKELLTCSSQK